MRNNLPVRLTLKAFGAAALLAAATWTLAPDRNPHPPAPHTLRIKGRPTNPTVATDTRSGGSAAAHNPIGVAAHDHTVAAQAADRFEAEIRAIASSASPHRSALLESAVARWAAIAPAQALERLPLLLADRDLQRSSEQIFSSWAASTPTDAWEWAVRRSDDTDRATYRRRLELVVSSLVRTQDFRPAAEIAAGSNGTAELIHGIVLAWAELRPDAAASWISGLPQGNIRSAGVSGFTSSLVKTDASLAVAFLHGLESDTDREAAISSATSTVAQTLPAGEATARLLALVQKNEGALFDRALYRHLIDAGGKDASEPDGIISLASLIQDETLRRAAARAYAARADPLAGLHVARSLLAGEERTDVMNAALRRWQGRDEAGAANYLQSLPAAEAEELQRTLQRR